MADAQWEQAPDGSWHRRSWLARYWQAVAVAAVAAVALGLFAWDNHQADRQLEDIDQEVCELTYGPENC